VAFFSLKGRSSATALAALSLSLGLRSPAGAGTHYVQRTFRVQALCPLQRVFVCQNAGRRAAPRKISYCAQSADRARLSCRSTRSTFLILPPQAPVRSGAFSLLVCVYGEKNLVARHLGMVRADYRGRARESRRGITALMAREVPYFSSVASLPLFNAADMQPAGVKLARRTQRGC
jgi:hypothetical protein